MISFTATLLLVIPYLASGVLDCSPGANACNARCEAEDRPMIWVAPELPGLSSEDLLECQCYGDGEPTCPSDTGTAYAVSIGNKGSGDIWKAGRFCRYTSTPESMIHLSCPIGNVLVCQFNGWADYYVRRELLIALYGNSRCGVQGSSLDTVNANGAMTWPSNVPGRHRSGIEGYHNRDRNWIVVGDSLESLARHYDVKGETFSDTVYVGKTQALCKGRVEDFSLERGECFQEENTPNFVQAPDCPGKPKNCDFPGTFNCCACQETFSTFLGESCKFSVCNRFDTRCITCSGVNLCGTGTVGTSGTTGSSTSGTPGERGRAFSSLVTFVSIVLVAGMRNVLQV